VEKFFPAPDWVQFGFEQTELNNSTSCVGYLYAQPVSKTCATVDSVLIDGGQKHIYLLQCTVSGHHDIKYAGLKKLWDSIKPPAGWTVSFVFLVPPDVFPTWKSVQPFISTDGKVRTAPLPLSMKGLAQYVATVPR